MKRLALGMACASALAWCIPVRSEVPNQDPAKLFESLDQNKDGSLTADEVGEDRKRFFERLVRVGDKNEDHKLSKDEFVASMSEQEKPVPAPQGRFGPGDRPMFSPGQMF
ncbi:MAG TPA: EF-hand domain-containing protein, partial [Caulifigura sp.]|nr:EF-hand domain-containing protein [Caulifigura sp.]